jgi:hypothetical protein
MAILVTGAAGASSTRIDVGVPRFVEWYMDYHQIAR